MQREDVTWKCDADWDVTHVVGQKCSALSRLYVSSSVWNNGFKDLLLTEVAKLKVGPQTEWTNFIGPVMSVIYVVAFRSIC